MVQTLCYRCPRFLFACLTLRLILELIFVSMIRPTILFFQENAGTLRTVSSTFRIMIAKLRCNVFMLSYRGASDEYPSQPALQETPGAALDHLLQRADIDTSRIVVFGRSLGVSALILENTFTSVQTWLRRVPFLKWLIGGSGSKIEPPILFISGLQDELVPPSHMQMLHAEATRKAASAHSLTSGRQAHGH
ncbi:unnamed protein product [Spirodela intermedia]|uniref:Uncharacterized protein n=1 Tax=Spirodela intermedia TaxID=51605 RepID=A0ABN7E9F5_SPIIN|nr:unnamed protein product [Spirodela intermedia]